MGHGLAPAKMNDFRARRRGIALVLGTAIISGVAIYVNGIAVIGIPSSVFTGIKNLLVAMVLAGVLLASREFRSLAALRRADWLRLAAIGLLGGAIPFLLFFRGLAVLAQADTGASLASFLHKMMFLYVGVLAFVFLRERLERYLLVAAVLLLSGTAALLTPSLQGPIAAYVLVILATSFWAAEITLSKDSLRHLGANVVAFGRMGFGAAFISIYLAATGQLGLFGQMSGLEWLWILVTVGFLFAYVTTFYHGLKRIDATSATSLLVLGAPITLGLSALLRGVSISPIEAAGMLLILLGVIGGVLRALRHTEVNVGEVVPSTA